MMMFIRSLIFNGTRILFRSKRANGGQYQIHYYTSRFQLMKQSFMDDDLAILAKELDSIPKIKPLDKVDENNIEFLNTIAPSLKKSFNLAAYVNKSETLKQLVKLNVDLSKMEKNVDLASFVLKCDFDADIQPLLLFLLDCGIDIHDVGTILTKNPFLFTIPVEELRIKVKYFEFRKFTKNNIISIFLKEPNIFNLKIQTIDKRLAHIGQQFDLTANDIRWIIGKQPNIILNKEIVLQKCKFMFVEEMGWSLDEIKSIILRYPYLIRKFGRPSGHKDLLLSFDYVHNTMKISHEQIIKFPLILQRRANLIKGRHLYLKLLHRDQYDPTRPLYVPLSAFYAIDDAEFCLTYAKTSVNDFNQFLKTL